MILFAFVVLGKISEYQNEIIMSICSDIGAGVGAGHLIYCTL